MSGKQSAAPNPLVSDKAPETSLSIHLHPLVLLTISDYITRHTLRQQTGPIVGAVIGQQNGRSLTLEHAYECLLAPSSSQDGEPILDESFFNERLEQYKEVHKAPQLDLVAVFLLGPDEGPQPAHLTVLKQVQSLVGSDAVLLLLFHPEVVDKMEGGKLPISLYDPFEEQVGESARTKFWERGFEVETGEAEMIGVDFVAKGGGNASAVGGQNAGGTTAEGSGSKEKKAKGKSKAKEKDGEDEVNGAGASLLSAEDDELIASLTAKANAIKMLNQRINLIRAYLSSSPKSYLTDAQQTDPPPQDINFALLRNINAMLSRLPLLAPTSSAIQSSEQKEGQQISQLSHAAAREREDVHLTSLLAALTRSVAQAQSLGSNFHAVQRERASKERSPYGAVRAGPMVGGVSLMDTGGP